jgi:hypothetical protein
MHQKKKKKKKKRPVDRSMKQKQQPKLLQMSFLISQFFFLPSFSLLSFSLSHFFQTSAVCIFH